MKYSQEQIEVAMNASEQAAYVEAKQRLEDVEKKLADVRSSLDVSVNTIGIMEESKPFEDPRDPDRTGVVAAWNKDFKKAQETKELHEQQVAEQTKDIPGINSTITMQLEKAASRLAMKDTEDAVATKIAAKVMEMLIEKGIVSNDSS